MSEYTGLLNWNPDDPAVHPLLAMSAGQPWASEYIQM